MKRLVVLTIVLMFISGIVFAADSGSHNVIMQVLNVCKINLNSTATITLTTIAPVNGGDPVTGQTDNTKLLQYTSLVPAAQTRRITANWGGADAAPAGTSLLLQATSVPAGCGTAAAQITLSAAAQSIVTAIGSCATGVGVNGAALTYSFNIVNVNNLVVGASSTVTVTLTLTDAS
jgi:hypothetical protein